MKKEYVLKTKRVKSCFHIPMRFSDAFNNWLFRTWTGKGTGSTSPCGNTRGIFGLPSIPEQRSFQGQEIAFITWYLVYFLRTFQCQEVMVEVNSSISWDVVWGMVQASIFHGKRILCIMNPYRTTATQRQTRQTQTQTHTHTFTQSVYFCCYIDLPSKIQLHFSCIVSWFSPARILGKQGNIFKGPPALFSYITAAQHCLATHIKRIYTSSTHKCLPTFWNTAYWDVVSRI